jgi:hypothetical protein
MLQSYFDDQCWFPKKCCINKRGNPFGAAMFEIVLVLAVFSVLDLESALAQERLGPNDFITRDIYSINSGSIVRGFISNGLTGSRELPLSEALAPGDEVTFAGHTIMEDESGVQQVYYRVMRVAGGENRELSADMKVTDESLMPELFISASDLVTAIGDDVVGCDVLPRLPLEQKYSNGDYLRPRRRPMNTLQQNLADIAALRDGLLDDLDIQVPDINDGYTIDSYNSGCRGFIAGENELGPWGELIVSEIIGENRGDKYHADVDPKYFFDVPEGYFGEACPNFNNMTTGQKLGAWVAILTRLAHEESSCDETKVNRNGTHTHAEGLFQGNANWRTFVAPNGSRILGRQNRGPGCEAKTSENGRWLLDYEDAITCAIQGLGDVSCGGFSRNFGTRPVCRPQSRPGRFFGTSSVSNQYFGPLKGTAASDRPKQRRIQAALRLVPGCVE